MSDFHHKEPIKEGKERLDIYVETGRVDVLPHEEPTVIVEGENKGLEITIERGEDTILLKAVNPKSDGFRWGRPPRANLVVRMPASCALTLRVTTGAVSVSDMDAPVCVKVVTGKANLSRMGETVDATVVTGKILYDGVLSDNEHRFSATTGRVKLLLDEQPNAWLDAKTVTGRLHLDFPISDEKSSGSITGRKLVGRLGDGGGRIRARVVTGSITVAASRGEPVNQKGQEAALVVADDLALQIKVGPE